MRVKGEEEVVRMRGGQSWNGSTNWSEFGKTSRIRHSLIEWFRGKGAMGGGVRHPAKHA